MSLENELLQIEMAFWTGGPEAYERHCDERCLVVFTEMATVMERDAIAKTAEAGRWRDPVLTPKGLTQPTEDTAIVAYECATQRQDGQPYRALIGSGYVRRQDGWKLAFHQQTPLA